MKRIIHGALLSYIILSPIIIGALAKEIRLKNAQLSEIETELAWASLDKRIDDIFHK